MLAEDRVELLGRNKLRRVLVLALIMGVAWLGEFDSDASAEEATAEVIRISKKRTVVTVELTGDTEVKVNDTVRMQIGAARRMGTIRRLTPAGLALVRVRRPLPPSVEVGTRVSLVVEAATESAPASEPTMASTRRVRLTKGGFKKLYWDEVSYLAAHRRAGARVDLEVGYLSSIGSNSRKGGAIQEDAELEANDNRLQAFTTAGYVGRSGYGGGIQLNYDATGREATADVTTASTGTVDKDKEELDRDVIEVRPYFAYLDRPTTGDLGFGIGLGVPIRMTEQERTVTIASEVGESDPTETSEVGVSVDAFVGSNSFAVILGATPGISGTVKSEGRDDVDRKWNQFSAHVETYGSNFNFRLGVVSQTSEDDYPSGSLTETSVRFVTAVDTRIAGVNVVPLFEYAILSRKLGSRKGDGSETEVGTRVALPGRYAPFISLSLNLRSEEETLADDRKSERETSGVKFAGGISI